MGFEESEQEHSDLCQEEDRWEAAVAAINLRNSAHALLRAMADVRNVEQVGMTAAPIPQVTALWRALAHFDRANEIERDY